MTNANECTCPSGDGSLRHPCPAHPAPVEQVGTNVGHGHVFPRADGVKMRCGGPGLCSECAADASRARAALAQPSPKCEFCGGTGEISGVEGEDDWVNGPCPRCAYPAQAEQAEAERPEVVGYLLTKGNGTLSILRAGSSDEPVMTVAQHDRIVDALRFERQQMDRAFTACINERDSLAKRWDEAVRYGARIEEQRDAALARVAELERVLRVVVNAADHGSWPTTVMHGIEKVREVLAGSAPPVKAQPEETPGEILAAKLIETWVEKHGKPAPWSKIVEITALATNMPNDERDRLLALDDDVDAQAQHSVPEKVRTLLSRAQCEIEHLAECLENVCEDEEDFDVREDVADGRVVAADIAHMLAAAPGKEVPQAWLDVQAERKRQVEVEGYHGFRDSHYINYELSKAARAYIVVSWHALSGGLPCKQPESWPWMAGFKWSDGRTMLVKACALTLAEIERLDRAGAPGKEGV